MNIDTPTRRSALAGAVVILSNVESPLAAAAARRLAPEAGRLELVSGEPDVARDTCDQLSRLREVAGLAHPVNLHADEILTEEGASRIIKRCRAAHDRVDAFIHVVAPANGPPSAALEPVLPALRQACAEMARQGEGRMIVALDLSRKTSARWTGGVRARLDAAFETLVRATARAYFSRNVCVNGVIVQHDSSGADRTIALSAGAPTDGQASRADAAAHSAAAGIILLLASASSCRITGQVFRVGGAPPAPDGAHDHAMPAGTPWRYGDGGQP